MSCEASLLSIGNTFCVLKTDALSCFAVHVELFFYVYLSSRH